MKKQGKTGTTPPIPTGGMGFNEILKRLSQTDPKEVRDAIAKRKAKGGK